MAKAQSGLCRCAAQIPQTDAERVEVTLKCYKRQSSDRLRWQLIRVVESVGYEMKKTWSRLSCLVKQQREKWSVMAEALRLPLDDHLGVSRNAARASNAESSLDCDQEFWISTELLLVLLAFWGTYRRELSAQRRTVLVSRALLEKLLASSFNLDLSRVPVELQEHCDRAPNSDLACDCVAKYQSASVLPCNSPQAGYDSITYVREIERKIGICRLIIWVGVCGRFVQCVSYDLLFLFGRRAALFYH